MCKGRRHSLHSTLYVLLCYEFVQGKAALLLVFTVLQQYVIANRPTFIMATDRLIWCTFHAWCCDFLKVGEACNLVCYAIKILLSRTHAELASNINVINGRTQNFIQAVHPNQPYEPLIHHHSGHSVASLHEGFSGCSTIRFRSARVLSKSFARVSAVATMPASLAMRATSLTLSSLRSRS